MKKVFLFLAAAVAFASCVKEAAPVLDQDNDNLVTITALATKTTLDGVNVVWEENDDIAVVYGGVALDAIPVFSTTESGSTVKFTGTHPDGYKGAASAYTVYPSDAVTLDAGVVKISHTIPAEQDGVVDSDLNLSFTELDVEALKAGNVSAPFHNALTLLKVIVPAGVKEVSLTSNSETLVGEAEFFAPADGKLGRKSVSNGGKTVTLTKGGSDLEGTHYLLVYPANTNGLDLRMVGSDDTVYESTAPAIKFLPSEYRTINLTEVFKMDVNATEAVSPLGGELVIPVAATEQYTYTVDIADDPSWISVKTSTYVQTKAFAGTNIVFDVDANTTGSQRSAVVTITWGTDGEKTFTVTQESAYLDFVYVDPADPASGLIQWQETFGVYADEACATEAKANISNVFTIDISDDFSKGAYMVMNMFKDLNTGAKYYANYDVEKKELTVYTSSAMAPSRTYYFAADEVVLVYDSSAKTFTSKTNPIQAETKYDFTGFSYRVCYLGNYSVVVKTVDPGAGGDLGDAVKVLGNTYKESYSLGGAYGNTPGNLVFEESDDLSKGNVKITNIFGCQATGMYATVSGNTITTAESAYILNLQGTNPIGQLILTIGDDGNITMSNQPLYNFYYLENYVATKQGGVVDLSGTWNQTVVGMTWPVPSATMTITVDGSTVTLTDFVATGTVVTTTFENNQIVVPAGTAIGSGMNSAGPLDADVVLTLEGDTFTAAPFSIGGYMNITSYSATNPNIE